MNRGEERPQVNKFTSESRTSQADRPYPKGVYQAIQRAEQDSKAVLQKWRSSIDKLYIANPLDLSVIQIQLQRVIAIPNIQEDFRRRVNAEYDQKVKSLITGQAEFDQKVKGLITDQRETNGQLLGKSIYREYFQTSKEAADEILQAAYNDLGKHTPFNLRTAFGKTLAQLERIRTDT